MSYALFKPFRLHIEYEFRPVFERVFIRRHERSFIESAGRLGRFVSRSELYKRISAVRRELLVIEFRAVET